MHIGHYIVFYKIPVYRLPFFKHEGQLCLARLPILPFQPVRSEPGPANPTGKKAKEAEITFGPAR